MTVKSDAWIHIKNDALIDPFSPKQVNPASYDLRVSGDYVNLTSGKHFSAKLLRMMPGMAYLASTVELIKMPLNVAATVYLKSSLARQGLDHALAGWVDPNFKGTLTMELHAHREIVIHAGQRIAQIVFQSLDRPPLKPYVGRYQHQKGPTEAIPDDEIATSMPEKEVGGKLIRGHAHVTTLTEKERRKRYQMGMK